MERRIKKHPILKEEKNLTKIKIMVDGTEISAYQGETIAAALSAQGKRINRYTLKTKEPRGIFCGIGQCTDCAMIVNGIPNVRTCVALVEENMTVETQKGVKNNG